MATNQTEENARKDVTLFALSTCVWCKKTKALLEEMAVPHRRIDVDLLKGEERERALAELKRFNPLCSFPSLVVDQSTCIVGFDEARIKEAFKR